MINRIYKGIIRRLSALIVLSIVTNTFTRNLLNRYYLQLSESRKFDFYLAYSKIFRRTRIPCQSGEWIVHFLGKQIKMILRRETMWLDWDLALSIIGHDPEIKQTYISILSSPHRPTVFFDVGANYGTHSLLMASQGLTVHAFEPNSRCISVGKHANQINQLSVNWHHTAIGAQTGSVKLTFPERETWLGSVQDLSVFRDGPGCSTEYVPLQCLDNYLDIVDNGGLLLKIDVEGFELNVLKGSERLFKMIQPLVIFESVEHRVPVYENFEALHYNIFDLPWSYDANKTRLTRNEFEAHRGTNFIAVPSSNTTYN